jgi:integrase
MAVLDSTSEAETSRTASAAASRRDLRAWEKISVGLKRQAGTDIYKSTVWEGGEERKIHFRARTLSEAKQRHEKRRVSVREGLEPVRTKFTLDELAEELWTLFEGLIASGERAPTTLERYRIQYRVHLSPTLGKRRVQSIRPEHISRLLADLRRKGLDVASVYSILSRLINRAVTLGLIVESPLKRLGEDERPKRSTKTKARRLEDEQCSKLIKHALPSTRVLLALYAYTGLRQSEGLGLTWDDVDLEEAALHVRKQLARKKRGEPIRRVALKSERGVRDVELLPELVTLLKQHKAEAFKRGHARPEDFVFSTGDGGPLFYRNVARDLRIAADRAGLNGERLQRIALEQPRRDRRRALLEEAEGRANGDDVPVLSTHDLRHTAVSRWIAAGLDVVEVARQAGDHPDVILRVYAGEFERAKRRDEIRERLAAGTTIQLA